MLDSAVRAHIHMHMLVGGVKQRGGRTGGLKQRGSLVYSTPSSLVHSAADCSAHSAKLPRANGKRPKSWKWRVTAIAHTSHAMLNAADAATSSAAAEAAAAASARADLLERRGAASAAAAVAAAATEYRMMWGAVWSVARPPCTGW